MAVPRFNTIICLSVIQGVDANIYKSSVGIDGSAGFQRFWKITFSLLTPFSTINMDLSAKGFLMTFYQALTGGGHGAMWKMTDCLKKLLNTVIMIAISPPFTLIANSAAAYAITRNRDKSKFFNVACYYFLSAIFIPFQVLMPPLVKRAALFGLDNLRGIALLYIVFGMPANAFLYTGYIKSLPVAMEEAAKIDGLNPLQTVFRIVFSVMMPMYATVAILNVMWTWNGFLMPPLLLTKPAYQTLQLTQFVFQSQCYPITMSPSLIYWRCCPR
ncbi:MAG: ABC transporter permease subunit [Treponema sp.]|nr:ABC transporter permease subunit [Treponema sp.]